MSFSPIKDDLLSKNYKFYKSVNGNAWGRVNC